jgi:hypothetical protein
MRPSVQKTLLLGLGAALVSSALGISGDSNGAAGTTPPVRIVLLSGERANTGADETGFARLLQEARREQVVGRLRLAESKHTAAQGSSEPYGRADLIERVRRRLLVEAGGGQP